MDNFARNDKKKSAGDGGFRRYHRFFAVLYCSLWNSYFDGVSCVAPKSGTSAPSPFYLILKYSKI